MGKNNQTEWALLEEGTRIHINNVEKFGRSGYFCPSENCGKVLQAVEMKNHLYKNYFRHDPYLYGNDVDCDFENESYIHKIAKEILVSLCKIKLPQIKKFPPQDIEGDPMILQDFRMMEAAKAETEWTFFLNEMGILKWGKAINPEGAAVILRPDVVFFNAALKPILFIELVVTNDIDREKSAKLIRLGIDTLRVKVPNQNVKEITKAFFTTEYTSWEYSRLENETEYTIPLSGGHSQRISEVDINQRELFRESTKCRAARVRSLIRETRIYLGSEPYKTNAGNLQQKIKSLTKAEERLEEQWKGLQESINENINPRYQRIKNGLEAYIEDAKNELSRINDEVRAIDTDIKRINSNKRFRTEFENNEDQIRSATEDVIDRIREIRKTAERINQSLELLRAEKEDVKRQYQESQKGSNDLKRRYFDYGFELIQRRDYDESFPLPTSYKNLLRARQYIRDINHINSEKERTIRARELFKSGTYRSWD